MKRIAMSALLIVALAAFAWAEYYKLEGVTRADQDLYKTTSGVWVITQYCYHYTYGEEAILKYEEYSYDNKIIWEDDSNCQVKKVFR